MSILYRRIRRLGSFKRHAASQLLMAAALPPEIDNVHGMLRTPCLRYNP